MRIGDTDDADFLVCGHAKMVWAVKCTGFDGGLRVSCRCRVMMILCASVGFVRTSGELNACMHSSQLL